MKWIKLTLAMAVMVLTTGCILRANYKRPSMPIPDQWRFSSNEASTIANIDWWKQFGDPVLDELIETALANNNDLGLAVGRVYEFAARVGVTRSYQLPEVSGHGAGIRQERSILLRPDEGPNVTQFRTYNVFSSLLNLTYYVDIWGKVQNSVDASFSDLLEQVEARRSVVLTLVSQVAANYVLLRQYDKQLEISKETYEARLASYNYFKARFEGGLISLMEVRQAEAEALTALEQVKQLEILIPQAENQLSILLGFNPGSIARGKQLEDFTLPPEIPAGLPSELLCQRPDILQAEAALIATNSRVAEAKTNFFPQISLTGAYGNESVSLHKLFTGPARSWFYGLDIFQQIFNAGRISYEVDIAKALRMQALYNYYLTIQKAFRDVDDALIAHAINLELVEILKKQVAVLQDYLRLAQLQYDNGQTEYINVLDAETKLFASQLELVQIQANALNSIISLYASLGGGWVIEADEQVFRPEPDIQEICLRSSLLRLLPD